MTELISYPLSFPQQSIWDVETYYEKTSYANLAVGVIIHDDLNMDLLEKSVNRIIKEHEAIRLKFIMINGEPRQYIADFEGYQVDRRDYSCLGGLKEFEEWKDRQARTPFRLIDSDLFYIAFVRLNNSKNAVFFKFHHLISDAWSLTMIINDVLNDYKRLLITEDLEIENKPSYLNYIEEDINYSNSTKYMERKRFWQEMFQTIPEFNVFSKSARGKRSSRAKRMTTIMPKSLSQKVKDFSANNKVSEFVIFFGAFALYLSKVTAKQDFVVGTPVLNRANHQQRNTAGMFISTIPFRITLDSLWEVISYFEHLSRNWKKILKNQRFPYKEILKFLRARHGYSGALNDVSFSYQISKFDVENINFETFWNFNGEETNTLSFSISDWKDEDILRLDYDYQIDIFTETEVEQIHKNYINLLRNIIENPTQRLSEVSLLSDEDKYELLYSLNITNQSYPMEKTIHELIEEQVIKTPEKIALIVNDNKLTYLQLNERANQLARVLRLKGISSESVVGILLKRSHELIIGILAVLKAGGAYLPIDPQHPIDRIENILRDSKTCVLLINPSNSKEKAAIEKLTGTMGLEQIDLNDPSLCKCPSSNLPNLSKPNNLAYVIYTSGSTGNPKGVMIEHRSVNNLIHALWKNFSKQKTIVSLSTVAFDIFLIESLVPLSYGLSIIMANEEEQKMPNLLFRLIKKYPVEMLQATPSKIHSLLKTPFCNDLLATVKDLFITGEPLPVLVLQKLQKTAPSARIFNMYGPTETTVWAMYNDVTKEDHITIGRPIANTQIYILDNEKEPVPKGVTGEIYIGGDGVARGYLYRPDLTEERFMPNPYQKGKTIYKTGDLGRWTADGEIEYLGRNDDQVKVRGFRIELGEIEKCLLKHEKLQDTVVVTHKDGRKKNYLCAYLVGDRTCSTLDIRAFLEQRLPDYMIPAKFIWLDALPLNPNCKVDKKALPDPSTVGGLEDTVHVPPRNSIDEELTGLWAKALDVDRVGIDDNFFLLGGDSLAIIEVLTGIWFRKWDINAQDFYDYPTVRQLSDKVRGIIKKRNNIEPAGEYPHPGPYFDESIQYALPAFGGNVLLTGATGFLGIHLLWELLNNTMGSIYCLVRGEDAERRLRCRFTRYFPASAELDNNRIKIVNGDMVKKQFGIPIKEYRELGENVSSVINAAGLVKHYGNYQDFMEANVQGTQEVIEFCLTFGKPLNHISTISIAGNQLVDVHESRCFSETELYIGQNYRDNLYIRSKFEAEVCVLNSRELGLMATIFRVGILTGRYSDGWFQGNINENAFYQKLKSLLTMRVIPEERMSRELEFTPVDLCASGILNIIKTNTRAGRIFHMLNHKTIKTDKFIEILKVLGIEIKSVDMKTFYQLIESSMHSLQSNFLRGIVLDLGEEPLNQSVKIKILSDMTQTYLAQTGFEWPDVNEVYLRKLLEHMIREGFLQQII